MPLQLLAKAVLTDWRSAERDLSSIPIVSLEAGRLRAEIERLRQEYQRLTEENAAKGRPGLPPFPTSSEPEAARH
jgi:hypothetical protein